MRSFPALIDFHNEYGRPPSDFLESNKLAPQLTPTARFEELNQATFSRTLQCRTGHAHIGANYRRFLPDEPTECPCGEEFQTREHILLECERHTVHRRLLGNNANERQIPTFVSTAKGIMRLAAFIEASGAYSKT